MTETPHALFSPSSAHRWIPCPGSVLLESQQPEDAGSSYAAEGAAAHELAAMVLRGKPDESPHAYAGRMIEVDGRSFEVTLEMAEAVQVYVDLVRQYSQAGTLYGVEVRVPVSQITGEQGAEGTADAIIVSEDESEVIVVDLKYGRGVEVSAEHNEQGQMYALGALEVLDLVGVNPTKARVVICQPRVSAKPSEWDTTVEALREFEALAGSRATEARHCTAAGDAEGFLEPGNKQCRFCRAKADCPALRDHALRTVADDFVDCSHDVGQQIGGAMERVAACDGTHIAALLPHLDLIETWCDAVRKRAHADLLAGKPIPGYKLVQGKRGARQWGDPAQAEALLKAMRLKVEEMYDLKLISPTSAEKLHKANTIGPRQWPKVQALITQAEGKPTVAPEADPRPAIVIAPVADDFSDVTAEALV